jgi:hypothetical protein
MTLYYEISETAAKRAKSANSFREYVPGFATAEYRSMVDRAKEIADQQKARVDPQFHAKIDHYLDLYARKLADNMNHGFAIDARVPSIMIAGGSNFPVRQKEKQNAARDKNMGEWQYIQGLLDKITSIGTGGISADDPDAIDRLKERLADLEEAQKFMKAINAYYRKHKTLTGCPGASEEILAKIHASMGWNWRPVPKPFEAWALSNNSANMRRIRDRIAELESAKKNPMTGWGFPGGTVIANTDENRLQVLFDEKPGEDMRQALKGRGFRWAPSQGAWQRQLTKDAVYAARNILPTEVVNDEA